ncbi:hypothetical protein DTO166G4_3680 [Paecilomyces variotii]|nr:hypothetical protein DTO166G4_3680 [Paecilomyces variotii]KAJ9230695.1 hypothetical protein DTO166G5_7208 [Paecilomyces variotii]KAJ9230707.1 hypothetical protein DTO169E5_8274 [Paecilomyces variotii]KAJ9308978.1 hypothetical protein DTO217A2_1654 [Paecilomyces variotii]KAJ9354747.1 hypothetical protein DTO280E4_6812 [Paecilomyces variotii]
MRKLLVPFCPACYDLVDSDRSTVEWVVLVRSEQLKQRGLSKIIRPLGGPSLYSASKQATTFSGYNRKA